MDPWNCPICHELLLDPVGLPCGHSFCQECLFSWIRSRSQSDEACSCPVCRAAIPRLPASGGLTRVFRPCVLLQQLLEQNHYVTCTHCDISHHPRRRDQHLEACPEAPVSCPRTGCDYVGPRRELPHHGTLCTHHACLGEPCGCEERGTRTEMLEHASGCRFAKIRRYIDSTVAKALTAPPGSPLAGDGVSLRSTHALGFPTIQIPSRSIPFLRDLVDEVQHLVRGEGNAL